jgi:pimeloyl-ACP methyl ester carboxylesterase
MAADAVELLDHLNTARAPVVGWSGGGLLALACGAPCGRAGVLSLDGLLARSSRARRQ